MSTERDQIVEEVLGDVDAYIESATGPNGPWYFGTLVIRRVHNTIRVADLDGVSQARIPVAELPNGDEAASELRERLEELDSETLDSL